MSSKIEVAVIRQINGSSSRGKSFHLYTQFSIIIKLEWYSSNYRSGKTFVSIFTQKSHYNRIIHNVVFPNFWIPSFDASMKSIVANISLQFVVYTI